MKYESSITRYACQTNVPKERTSPLSPEKLPLVHSNASGPMEYESFARAKYFVNFTDECSHWAVVYPVKNKFDVFSCFSHFRQHAEIKTGCKVRALRSDTGDKYLSKAFTNHLIDYGIEKRHTIA